MYAWDVKLRIKTSFLSHCFQSYSTYRITCWVVDLSGRFRVRIRAREYFQLFHKVCARERLVQLTHDSISGRFRFSKYLSSEGTNECVYVAFSEEKKNRFIENRILIKVTRAHTRTHRHTHPQSLSWYLNCFSELLAEMRRKRNKKKTPKQKKNVERLAPSYPPMHRLYNVYFVYSMNESFS